MLNKKGIELSINFMVMLILALVVFGFGVKFVADLFTQAEEIRLQLDKNTEAQIEALLDRGDRFVIPIQTRDTEAGSVALFALGVLNIDATNTFEAVIDCTAGIDLKDLPIKDPANQQPIETSASGCDTWLIPKSPILLGSIVKNEKKKVSFGILPPKGTPRGIYLFKVVILEAGTQYGDIKQVRVRVN